MPVANIPSLTILYVADAAASAIFYSRLFEQPAIEASPTFAMFLFPGGPRLGLWSREGVRPQPTVMAGSSEIAIVLESPQAVDARHKALAEEHPVLQPPTDADFGRTFVISDPDGHRVRFYHPDAAA